MSDLESSTANMVEADPLSPPAAPACPFRGGAHKALAEVPMPRCFRHLQKDHRGYPVPFVMMQNPVSLITLDPRRFQLCSQRKLCGICGAKLGNKKWFVAGKISATNRMFVDPPMHEECARYSLRVCPFLSNHDMKYSRRRLNENEDFNPHVEINQRSSQFLLRTNGYRTNTLNGRQIILANPWEYVEEWRDGQRVNDNIASDAILAADQPDIDR